MEHNIVKSLDIKNITKILQKYLKKITNPYKILTFIYKIVKLLYIIILLRMVKNRSIKKEKINKIIL